MIFRIGYNDQFDIAGGLNTGQIVNLTRNEATEVLEALASRLGFILVPAVPPAPTESAWVVVPESPGIPFSEEDQRRSGFNLLPCKLEVAQEAVEQLRAQERTLFTGFTSLTEAFRSAVVNYSDQPAYIIDHGDATYSVIA